MKKQLLILPVFIILFCQQLSAQTELWGTTQSGGTGNNGIIYAITNDTSFNIIHEFAGGVDGTQPNGKFVMANDGYIYGTTVNGGIANQGTCFKIDPVSHALTNVHNFINSTGKNPTVGLIIGNDGNLYGACGQGGANSYGVLYKIDPVLNTYTVLHHFSMPDGGGPGKIMQASNNKLYGSTAFVGANWCGTIYSYDLTSGIFTNLHDNDTLTGRGAGFLEEVSPNKLIGSANYGGANGYGVIYSYDITSNVRTVVYNFDSINGFRAAVYPVLATNGKIYGTTVYGGAHAGSPGVIQGAGVLYSFDPNTNIYTNIFDFNDSITGSECQGGMMQATNGLLYSTAHLGGNTGEGTTYSFDLNSNTFTKIVDFSNTIARRPSSPLLEINTITRLNQKEDKMSFSVSPNPSRDYVMINNQAEADQVKLIDIAGKEFAELSINAFGNTTINVSAFPNVFFIKNSKGQVLKIVKE